ncbi:MAG: hypothetical protein ACYDB7_02945 [Mycobacteriales bacterium]
MRTLLRLSVVLATATAALGAAFAGVPAFAGPGGGTCTLQGTANFSGGGLTTTSQSLTYSFTGTLSSCQSNVGGVATGAITAGDQIKINGVTYQEPLASLTGSCSSSTTSGTSIVQWSDGTYTVIAYTTTGAGATVALQGSVIKDVVLTGGPNNTTYTLATTGVYPVNDSAVGALVFGANPTACATGVTSASITGQTGIGATS